MVASGCQLHRCRNVEVIDVYRGGILADWYVPLLILLTIISYLMPHTRI